MVLIPTSTNSAMALSAGSYSLSLPNGVALSRSGDLSIVDSATGAILVSSQEIPPTLAFPNTAPGSTSALHRRLNRFTQDGPKEAGVDTEKISKTWTGTS